MLYVVIGLIVLAVIVFFVLYNSLVAKKNQVENAFATMDVYLKKRYDLVPNLVATVQQYMKHEADTLTKVTELRARAQAGNLSTDEEVAVNNQLGRAIGNIMLQVEQYPDLKANQNFLDLQGSLNEIEEQLSAARRAYNASVTDLNNAIEMFPTNLLAGMMGYSRRTLFEISEGERQNVNVKQLFQG
jgi:LemA protein